MGQLLSYAGTDIARRRISRLAVVGLLAGILSVPSVFAVLAIWRVFGDDLPFHNGFVWLVMVTLPSIIGWTICFTAALRIYASDFALKGLWCAGIGSWCAAIGFLLVPAYALLEFCSNW